MDELSRSKTWKNRNSRGKHGAPLQDFGTGKDFLDQIPKAQAIKAKIDVRLNQAKKFLHSKGNN